MDRLNGDERIWLFEERPEQHPYATVGISFDREIGKKDLDRLIIPLLKYRRFSRVRILPFDARTYR